MFYILAISLCLALLVLSLLLCWLLLFPMASLVRWLDRKKSRTRAAGDLLFLRLSPTLFACAVTFGVGLPAFVKFEPNSTNEGMGLRLSVLALLGAITLGVMAYRAWFALRAASRVRASWRKHAARMLVDEIDVPVYCVEGRTSLLAVSGIFYPAIFIAKDIFLELSRDELHAALAHEIAHVSAYDNLKQLLLMVTGPPRWLAGFTSLDQEWGRAAEIAADQHAVATGSPALELSSALVKVSRLNMSRDVEGGLACHLVPPACSSALEVRVTRLSEMLEGRGVPMPDGEHRRLSLLVIVAFAAYLACLSTMLPLAHELLESLVR